LKTLQQVEGDLLNGDTADDYEWPMTVISGTISVSRVNTSNKHYL